MLKWNFIKKEIKKEINKNEIHLTRAVKLISFAFYFTQYSWLTSLLNGVQYVAAIAWYNDPFHNRLENKKNVVLNN